MPNPIRHFWFPQTYGLLLGLAIGYASFVFWLGLRWIVLLSGAMIVSVTIFLWYLQLQAQLKTLSKSTNLLESEVFLNYLNLLCKHTSKPSQTQWRFVQQQVISIQQLAKRIAQQEPTFIPELLETLHTVLGLVEQLLKAFQVTQQVQTPRYQKSAQQQLKSSQIRLQKTHDQLQEFHDQLVVERLEKLSSNFSSGISQRLKILISENEKGIIGD